MTVEATFWQLAPIKPADGVQVGDIVWAYANSIPNLGGTATFQSSPYVYDRANQVTWYEATTGVSGSTSGVDGQTGAGVCPPGWRLPTVVEVQALWNASAVGNIPDSPGTWTTIESVNGVVFRTPSDWLFFSASGRYRTSHYASLEGNYWTSTQFSATDGYNFYISKVGTFATGTYDTGATSAFSVRCVRPL